jgi:hypothetical protein
MLCAPQYVEGAGEKKAGSLLPKRNTFIFVHFMPGHFF